MMLENNFSDDKIAWYLLMNTRVPNWEQAKQVAKKMRNDHNDEIERENE